VNTKHTAQHPRTREQGRETAGDHGRVPLEEEKVRLAKRSRRATVLARLAAPFHRRGSGAPSEDLHLTTAPSRPEDGSPLDLLLFYATGGEPDAPGVGSASAARSERQDLTRPQPAATAKPALRSSASRQRGAIAALLGRPPMLRCAAFILSAAAAVLVLGAAEAAPAVAASPWWHLSASLRPVTLKPGAEGTVVLQAENIGDAPTSGAVTLSTTLPQGLAIVEEGGIPQVSLFAFSKSRGAENVGLTSFIGREVAKFCKVVGQQATCDTEGVNPFLQIKPIAPYEDLELRVKVKDEGAAPGSDYGAEVSGGGVPPASVQHPLVISASEPAFATEQFSILPEEEGGSVDTRAGSHPFQLTATFDLNQDADESTALERAGGTPEAYARPPALARNLEFRLPPGQIGNATVLPQCSSADFTANANLTRNLCPDDTVIGVASVSFYEPKFLKLRTYPVPLFNLVPARGEPARFGFDIAQSLVVLDTAVRSEKGPRGEAPDYGVTVSTHNTTQLVNFISSSVTFWGAPEDSRHAESHGWGCLASGAYQENEISCESSSQAKPPAFLTLPTNCSAPFDPLVEGISWPQLNLGDPTGLPLPPFEYNLQQSLGLSISGCNQVPFAPQIEAEPTSNAATSPTGLNFDINVDDEGLLNSEGLAQSQIKKAVVTLPEGFTTNPSVAEGLHACSEAQYESEAVGFNSEPNGGCPENSKIGDVEIESPLVTQKVEGSLFVARQTENPNHNLLTIYMVAKNAELGILIKQALKVVPNPTTGQLTTEVDNIPELPFSHFELSFRQGQRSPLVTPPTCGNYTVGADLYPYSDPTVALHRETSFKIEGGPESQPCPSGTPPFHPVLEAGTLNNAAGTYSPFVTHITRKDSEQEITRFSIKLPTGMLAKLKGVSECSDAQIAQAKSREVEGGGTVEQEHPSCPANSEVGHSLVGSGVGNILAYAPGKLYFAGPYHGSPISLVSITAAKVGPFDLGTVVVRFALDVNHETAEVSVDGANSDPIPHIVDGIPIHLRDIRAYVDRPNFTLNPTSCAKKSTAATVLGSGANFASSSDDVPVTVSSPFQAADCASLGFKPQLALSLTGKKTHRGALPAFKAVLTYPKGGAYANIAKAQVTLPGSEFLEQGHLKNVCTRKVFETGKNPGENCPKNSIYGKARATTPLLEAPLEGPVYLRTGYGTKLPELAAALNGPQISITLAGTIDSVHQKGTEGSRIRNTFALVPDAPVEKFTLELKGGKKGLLVNSTDVCKGTHKALAAFTGQNGKLDEYEPPLTAQCGKGGGKKKSGAKKSKGGKGKGGK
jgi:hypothetical protein